MRLAVLLHAAVDGQLVFCLIFVEDGVKAVRRCAMFVPHAIGGVVSESCCNDCGILGDCGTGAGESGIVFWVVIKDLA